VVAFQYGGVISFSLDTSFCILEWTVGGAVVGAAFACRWLKLQSTIILGNHEGVAALLFEACSLRCLEDVNEDAIALDSSMYFSVSARARARSLVRRTTPHVAFETCLVVAVIVTFRMPFFPKPFILISSCHLDSSSFERRCHPHK
jgi:hypothetical protein